MSWTYRCNQMAMAVTSGNQIYHTLITHPEENGSSTVHAYSFIGFNKEKPTKKKNKKNSKIWNLKITHVFIKHIFHLKSTRIFLLSVSIEHFLLYTLVNDICCHSIFPFSWIERKKWRNKRATFSQCHVSFWLFGKFTLPKKFALKLCLESILAVSRQKKAWA